ncbi:MAG: PP2C family protein-serine/threonine phosphatase, partial [Planctomycetia bacterium]
RAARAELAARPLASGLRLTVLGADGPENRRIVFDSGPTAAGSEARTQRSPLPVPGGPWTLEIAAAPTFGGRGYDLSWAVALVSLVLTGVLADRDLAAHAARARETEAILEKERIRRDLVIARDIQRGLLPAHETHLEGFDVAGWNQPADETGGDYYDFVPLGGGLLAIGIADVTGHGIGAALVVAEVRALFRAEILRSRELDAAVARLHDLIVDDLPEGRLVTACFAVLSAADGLWFLSAGHGPILVRSAATRAVRMLRPQGLPIGFLPEPRYAAPVSLPLEPGDVFMVLTDGFVEWRNPSDEQFGIERIEAVLAAYGHLPAADIIARLREAVLAFAAGTRQADDLTAVVVRRPVPGTGQPNAGLIESGLL